MTCPSCLAIVPLAIGLGLSLTDSYYIGVLLTLLSVCIYLYYRDIKVCKQCLPEQN